MPKNDVYHQPLINYNPLSQYPEVHDLVMSEFPDVTPAVHDNLYVMLSNFLLNRSFAVSRSHEHYAWFNRDEPDTPYTRYHSVKAQDLLVERGLADMRRGTRAKKGYDKGFVTVLTATQSMDDMLRGIILKPVKSEPSLYPVMTMEGKTVEGRELRGMLFDDTILTREGLILDYNRTRWSNEHYFSDMKLGFEEGSFVSIEGMPFEVFRELVEEEGATPENMATNVFFTAMYLGKGGGRLFQKCNSYQYIKRGIRQYLTINGKETKEADFSGLHLNMIHFINGTENPHIDDPYYPVVDDLGLPEDCREAVKKSIIVAVNAADYREYARAMAGNHMPQVKHLIKNGARLKDVYGSMVRVYGNRNGFFDYNPDRPAIMQHHESNILKTVMGELIEKGIDAVPLHDAVIYDADHEGTVEQIMKDKYRIYTGNDIAVKSK